MKELPLDKKYAVLLDQSISTDSINYASHQKLNVLDAYYDFYFHAQKNMLPSYLGTVFDSSKQSLQAGPLNA